MSSLVYSEQRKDDVQCGT